MHKRKGEDGNIISNHNYIQKHKRKRHPLAHIETKNNNAENRNIIQCMPQKYHKSFRIYAHMLGMPLMHACT